MNTLERILQEHSLNTEQSILMGQWEFDRNNIPNALKAIAIVFPHFSLHDETHSLSILNNIVKMLGEEAIKKLSCTDLWLLLESAYCHDLGMVVTVERLEQALESDAFLKHFMRIEADESHPCNAYTKVFNIEKGKLYFKEEEFKVSQLDAVRFLLADYYRNRHAENSKKTVTSPLSEVGIESPRSTIPSRLFALLSDICRTHTLGFESVMALPKNEDGIGLDECHPRFISCMLRLGDLLDIDNNRFSETLVKTVKALPSDSRNHFEKHKAISHLSVNTKSIEIEAKCNTPKVAQVIQEWFDWISDEIKNQTLKWNSIVPDGLECYLPTLSYLRTKIKGYETVSDSKKTKFTIDTTKALELLQGKNFYNDVFDSIRELIQNAVDSTLLKIYLDAKKEGVKFDELGDSFLDYARKYNISVRLAEIEGKHFVEVSDRGLGLRRDQLTYLINAGSSSKDVEKKLIIEEMPEWMRPSGVFGIGFHSVFLLTDKVEVLTKDCFKDERMWIEMYSPDSPMKGDVYLKTIEEAIDTGFKIRFEINKNVGMNKVQDPFNSFQQDMSLSMVESRIREYAAKSVVPITISHDPNNNDNSETIERQRVDFYDEKTGIELSFNKKSFDFSFWGGPSYFYRNAKVSGSETSIMFLSPEVNIHYGSAKDILTLDRGAFKDGKTVVNKTIDAIVNFMNSTKYSTFLADLKEVSNNAQFLFSFFVEYYEKKTAIVNKHYLADVNSFSFDVLGETKTVNEVVSTPELRFITSSKQALVFKKNEEGLCVEANLVPILSPHFIVEIVKLLFKLASDYHKHCYCTRRVVDSFILGAEFLFTNAETIPQVFLSMADIKPYIESSQARCYLNYLPGYEDIRIPSEIADSSVIDSFITKPIPNFKIEKIISPFIKVNNTVFDCRNEELYSYVSKITGKDVHSVKSAYDRFVEAAISTGMNVSKREKE